jgi:hypothetical protein
MRIEANEDDVARAQRRDLIRSIQKHQEQLDEQQKTKTGKKKKPETEQASGDKPTSSIGVQAADAEKARQVEERAESTVKAAHKGQKAGENWQAFSDRTQENARPASIAQLTREAEEKIEDKRDNKRVLSAREIQNNLAVAKKQIRG